ncbi:mitochondrial transcription rescue factor 1 isoform X1 [Camelus ferus]|uniref:Mitochondrial transcription rescue factor 1 isoform X1 n=2 Tax=Camelus TaxID=9836 RepID=A0A8B7KBP9_CAMFR|nr:mitochondrial transcription rescue factor 1 isoform X1 [Camelus ferus]XP_010963673.1 mitochondrial transcription rescue factor 1 isoform X1 [Camelus bactrianus]XP_010963675.1 mitochondrial transcription rescue factor 1 isoform X1 [Camelus bactrianus]XP_010963676.1 mitochondrial transcription rescue factor 1 isoform X1 [Camelus bactrianus]XP_010963677.1 mitochondrial transcription rescue factor 1 isoform X1 [Camelus bactrianus]XP_010963678.1 mitochondrial transcription rescue factor 1 isofor
MAMTSVRLPTCVFRKPDAWIGLCRVLQGTPSHKPCASWNRYLYFSSTKLNASNYKILFHNIFSLRLPRLLVSPEYILPFSIRLKSNVSSKKSTKKTLQKVEDEEESEDERDRSEMSEQEDETEDDPSVVKDYKDLDKVVQSFRYDVILKTGLDIGRNKVEDAFYKGELRLNGEKLWKKSRTVKVGDTLDLLIGEDKEAETETVMRILLKKVFEEKTGSEKYRVVLRRWKTLKLPKKSFSVFENETKKTSDGRECWS